MRVQFDFDVDDLVDANARALFGSQAAKNQLRASRAWTAAVVGVLAGLFLWAILSIGDEANRGLVPASAFVTAAIEWALFPGQVKRSWRRHYLGLLGSEGPFTCIVELTPEGVQASQNNTKVLHEWEGVSTIEETSDSIDFRCRTGGFVVVRNRAFESPEERDKFLAMARRYHDQSDALYY